MAMETLPESVGHSPDEVLGQLRAEADHKAALRMYFSAAELLRGYRGPFADETTSARERLAREYEMQGTRAEHERKEHGPVAVSVPPPPAKLSWQCPACQTSFPAGLVICGHCGLDLRTGKHYQAVAAPVAPTPHVPPNPTPMIRHHSHSPRHHRQDFKAFWLIAVVLVGLFIVLVLLGRVKTEPKPEPPPPRKGTWQW